MSLRANNSRFSTRFLHCLRSTLCSMFLHSLVKLVQTGCSRIHKHTHTHTERAKNIYILKMAVGRSNASKADGGQINKAFWIF